MVSFASCGSLHTRKRSRLRYECRDCGPIRQTYLRKYKKPSGQPALPAARLMSRTKPIADRQ